MSSDMEFSGSFKRFLKGDIDPANIFGFNPTKEEFEANKKRRGELATQIKFEKENREQLLAQGWNPAEATQQIKRLKGSTRVTSIAKNATRNPIRTMFIGPSLSGGMGGKKRNKEISRNNDEIQAGNTERRMAKDTRPTLAKQNLTSTRVRQSILGGLRFDG